MLPIAAILKGLFLISIKIKVMTSWHHPKYFGSIRINILNDCFKSWIYFLAFQFFKIVDYITQKV